MKKFLLFVAVLLVFGFLWPERINMPVTGADKRDWNPKSFWAEPWGSSGVHKGIDIFAKHGTPVVSTTDGVLLYAGVIPKGGNVILVLGPKWRLHYFAHLNAIYGAMFSLVRAGDLIGAVGDTGNALGKQPHLHYSIVRIFPALWKMDDSTQGYKKSVFIDPGYYLEHATASR